MTGPPADQLCDDLPGPAGAAQLGQHFPFAGRHALFIVAHADDEVLAAGAQLGAFQRVSMIHTTDGAVDRPSARARGFATRADYASARRAELRAALAAGGVAAECHDLGYRCVEASFHLAAMARRLAPLIARIAPDLIFTQAYEGGHPDHDATAFAVHAALRRLPAPPPLWELTGYHRESGQIERGRFASAGGAAEVCVALGPEARAQKRRMLDGFRSQLDVVAQFPIDYEMFRRAPAYDFCQPPHPGPLGYEGEGFGIDPRQWRALAWAAERQLRPGVGAWLAGRWLALKLWWQIGIRRAHPGHPRLVRLMRSCRTLSELDPPSDAGARSRRDAPR